MISKVSIKKCSSYNQEELYSAISNACLEAEMPDVINKTILLKVNILSDAKPEDCITTNPEFVRALARFLKNKGASKIYAGDSPGLHSSSFCGINCGINKICSEEGITWVNFAENPTQKKIKGLKNKYQLASILDSVDYVFSVPKFKTHMLMYATGSVKNMFGAIVGLNKSKCHLLYPSRESFAKFIVNLYESIKPDFCIMDGVIGMDGAGPANGKPYPSNLILASKDGYSLDYSQAVLMGYKPQDLPIIAEAKRRHLINKIDYTDIVPDETKLKNFNRVKITPKTHFIKTLVLPFIERNLKIKKKTGNSPVFSAEKCIHCKRCINICPAKALEFNEETKSINIDTDKCIRCYCCHEMCPANAIEVNND